MSREQGVRGPANAPLGHPWQGTDDGHNCESCAPDSVWRCDKPAHEREPVLPPLPPSALRLTNPRDLLTPEQNAALNRNLAETAKRRRRAEQEAAWIPMH